MAACLPCKRGHWACPRIDNSRTRRISCEALSGNWHGYRVLGLGNRLVVCSPSGLKQPEDIEEIIRKRSVQGGLILLRKSPGQLRYAYASEGQDSQLEKHPRFHLHFTPTSNTTIPPPQVFSRTVTPFMLESGSRICPPTPQECHLHPKRRPGQPEPNCQSGDTKKALQTQ